MKKKFSILIAVLLLLFAIPLLGGCAVDPWEVDWVLDYYVKDGESYSTSFDDMDYFATVPIDLVQLSFTEDSTFAFTDWRGIKRSGTFTHKSEGGHTAVKLTFEDGEKAEGWCSMSYFDGAWYDAYFEIDGVEYYFEDDRGYSDPIASGLAREGLRLARFEGSDEDYYDGLYRGEAEYQDGVSFLTIRSGSGEFFRFNLARTTEDGSAYYRYTVYEYDSEYVISESSLREGSCAVKYDAYSERFAIHFRGADRAEEDEV